MRFVSPVGFGHATSHWLPLVGRPLRSRLHCRGGSVSVLVSSDPHLFRGPQELRAFGRTFQRLTLTPTEARTVSVPLLPAAEDRCTARFSVFPTAVPGNGDPRELGLHFTGFTYAP